MKRLAASILTVACFCLPAVCQGTYGIAVTASPYNAVCDGREANAVANANAIQAAINALQPDGGIVYFPAGVCVLGIQTNPYPDGTTVGISLPAGTILKGQGRFVTKIQASSSLLPNTAPLIRTANWASSCPTGASAPWTPGSPPSGCPIEFGVEDMTLDGNGNPGNGNVGPRGTASSGAVLTIRGSRYLIRRVDVVNSPYDGIYSEGIAGTAPPFDPVWPSISSISYGNVATYDTVRPNNNFNNGLTYYGPTDSQLTELIPFYNGNYGAIFGCATNGICGANSYLTNFHAWNNNNWGLEVETILQGSNIQSESNGKRLQSGSAGGIHVYEPTSPTGSGNYGIVLFSNVQTFDNIGDGLKCESPDVTYISNYPPANLGYSYFNNIQGIQSWGNSGWGINASVNCTKTVITNPTLTYNSGGGVNWPVREGQLNDLISKLNTGNGLDLSGVSSFGFIRVSGVSEGNTGMQLAYPTSATTSNGSVLQLSLYTTGTQAISGVQPTNLLAQISQVTQSGSGIAISNNANATFATLPSSPNNGDTIYCTDCTVATPTSCMNVTTAAACTCTSGGTGAYAKRIDGAWLCN